MKSLRQLVRRFREQQRIRRARLPWAELEAEAQRQHCSEADIFFDRAGHAPPRPAEPIADADAGGASGLTLPHPSGRRRRDGARR